MFLEQPILTPNIHGTNIGTYFIISYFLAKLFTTDTMVKYFKFFFFIISLIIFTQSCRDKETLEFQGNFKVDIKLLPEQLNLNIKKGNYPSSTSYFNPITDKQKIEFQINGDSITGLIYLNEFETIINSTITLHNDSLFFTNEGFESFLVSSKKGLTLFMENIEYSFDIIRTNETKLSDETLSLIKKINKFKQEEQDLFKEIEVFVPHGSEFIGKKIRVKGKSIYNIIQAFGYNIEQIHSYKNLDKTNSDITSVIFEVFTDSIICVVTSEEVKNLSKSIVDNYLSSFSLKTEYDSYRIESILSKGIKNKTITSDFFSRIFSNSLMKPNSVSVIPQIGYEVEFENGFLTKFTSSDGLNKWAKEWKNSNPKLFKLYENNARSHWGTDKSRILNEINVQASAYSLTPDAGGNEYIDFHRSNDGIINFKMLLVAHYNEPISLQEFKEINKGRFTIVNEFNKNNNKSTSYKVNKSYFTFNKDGILENAYSSK